jgi:putative inorganic carbon (hco3(-)) transporter
MDSKGKIVLVLNKLLLADLCIFVLLCPFFERVPKITAVAGFILWVSVSLIKYKKKFCKYLIPKTNLGKPLLFFVAALVLSVIFSLDFYHSQSVLFERYGYYMFFFLIGLYLAQDKKNIYFLMGAIIGMGIIIGAGGVWDLIRFNPRRLFSFYGRDLILSPFLTLSVPFLFLVAVFFRNKFLKIISGIGFILLFITLLFNASRAAIGAILFTILAISFFKSKRIAISLLIIFLLGGFFFLPNYLQKRVSTTFTPDKWGDRVVMWKSAIVASKDFPIFGAGLGTTKKLLYKYAPSEGYKEQGHVHAHNTYLELLAEVGIVGLISFLFLFLIYFKNFFRFYKNALDNKIKIINLGFLGSVLATLILALAGTIIMVGLQDATLFWFFFGLAAGLTVALDKNKQSKRLDKVKNAI